MIELQELTKRYEDGVLALDHVSYTIQPGEIFCLLGQRGRQDHDGQYPPGFPPPHERFGLPHGQDATVSPGGQKARLLCLGERAACTGMFTARQNLRFFAELGARRI